MKLTLGESTYSEDVLSLYRLSIGEIRAIKRHTGMTFADWKFGLVTYFREDPDFLLGLVYVMKRRAGETPDWTALEQVNAQDIVDGLEWEQVDQDQLDQAQAAHDAAQDKDPAPPDAEPVEASADAATTD